MSTATFTSPALSQHNESAQQRGDSRSPASRPLAAVTGAELQAPLIQGGHVRYANLDYGASAPALTVVSAYLNEILPYYASVHRGAGYASQISTSVYENARNIVRDFVGGRADDSVIFTRNTTDSLNLLAGCLPIEDGRHVGEVLYLDIEHHANLLPWQRVPHRSIVAAGTLADTVANVRTALSHGGVSLLAVTGASNVTGEILPIKELAALAHEFGARIVVDAAQLAPHRRIDIAAADVDYLVFSGHKLYAPFGAGVLVGRPDWLDAGTPHLAGGGAVREARLDSVSWATGPARHEGGSPNVLGAATLARATQVIASLDHEEWHAHEAAIRTHLVDGLNAIDGVTVHQIFSDTDPQDTIGVVNFSLHGYDAGLVAAYLAAEHGIGLRDGRFCAHPLLKRLGLPSGSLRASFGVGSRLEDATRLIAGIQALKSNGLGWDYVVDAGRWVPANDHRSYPEWAPNTPGTAGAAPCSID
ncbi:aminotransferase class V-fold PLP-dependent enzyme [Arthrobacter sp. MI7-26]|uniref:aminotransferase class V-fold PLP-dependent enzyme n=1 Tax=Arthrobacter sp. MI7-26 TaxID=2993653 RepID=UPI002248A9B0|nr:aminotransferase class V-fold PLP-dependent enzyme [Arthrobacter sp. MI7-26]MCX2746558.1 aminotransferase class V-fold PLP-dependent enzyme [Arthrobacter sp. MI7-26]